MIEKFQELLQKFNDIEKQMSDPNVVSDINKYNDLNKKRMELEETVSIYNKYINLTKEIQDLEEILKDDDQDLREIAEEELPERKKKEEQMNMDLALLLLPKDPNDNKNVYVEIRSGTGGEEAALFAKDLYEMYTRYFSKCSWSYEIVDFTESDVGGFAKIVCFVKGNNVYQDLKYESGTHRVQRVPTTESGGRIHTSAATVAIMPEATDVDIEIDNKDLKIDTYRSSGAGGQHVNKTDSAIRITHLPSGIVVTCQEDRSQHKNKDKAMKLLQARLLESEVLKQQQTEASKRKSQVGSGDRSEKIRTYNYPQGRVTDHRIGLTLYKLDSIMLGSIEEIIEKLKKAEQIEKLKEL